MTKSDVARTLDLISRYIQLSDPNPFKARAFEKAARAVEGIEEDLDALVASGGIYEVSGVGKATGKIIEEIVRTGTAEYLAELRAQYPPGIFQLMRVPKLGLKKVGQLHAELGIGSLDELEAAARDGRVAGVKGFGAKTAGQILKGIAFARLRESSFLLPIGLEAGELLRERLASLAGVKEAAVSGSVRRRLEVIHNVNLVVATTKPKAVAAHLAELLSDLEELDAHTLKGTVRGELDVLVHVCTPRAFGATLLRTTGSAEFVAAFESLTSGIPDGESESAVFKSAGIPFVEPERRESGEDLKVKKRVKLVEVTQLRGTFHVHTTFSDGRNTVGEMLTAAHEREWEYVGISDHSPTASYAGGLTEERLRLQHAEIGKQEKTVTGMRVFRGTEADILPNGTMDYGDKVLSKLDFVVASVHSGFTMNRDEMTDRILRAMDNPYVTFLGHLTGRKLLSRDGYSVEYDRIFEKAGQRNVMIEINGNPNRLDLDWRHIRRALDWGVLFSINPDAHSVSEYNAVITGTWVARKGGLGPQQIFNTREVAEVAEWFEARKKSGATHG